VTTVAIVDDEALVRAGLRMILGTEPDLDVVGEADDGDRAVDLVTRLDPDVLLLDIRMPTVDGLEVTRRLSAAGARTRVLVLTTFDSDRNVYDALAAGACGFLLKDTPADRLVTAIRAAAAGDSVLAPSAARRVADELARRRPPERLEALDALTEREHEVLELMADGCSNAEIAQRLVIGEGTVKTHVARILMKLGVRDRLQAVVLAYQSGRR
jgi:DNA-binding NarL/FixJ family response regulator